MYGTEMKNTGYESPWKPAINRIICFYTKAYYSLEYILKAKASRRGQLKEFHYFHQIKMEKRERKRKFQLLSEVRLILHK